MCCAMQCCVVLCFAMLCYAVLCCAVLCCVVLCCVCCVVLCLISTTVSEYLYFSALSVYQRLQRSGVYGSMLRTQDREKRSSAKTVTLQPNCFRWTVSGWGPNRRRMGWLLAANQVRHSTDTSLSWRQSGPRLHMITTRRARPLCIGCGSRHDLGLGLRSSWLSCGCDFFISFVSDLSYLPSPVRISGYVVWVRAMWQKGRSFRSA